MEYITLRGNDNTEEKGDRRSPRGDEGSQGGGVVKKGNSRKTGPVLLDRFQVSEGRGVLQVGEEEDGPEVVITIIITLPNPLMF